LAPDGLTEMKPKKALTSNPYDVRYMERINCSRPVDHSETSAVLKSGVLHVVAVAV